MTTPSRLTLSPLLLAIPALLIGCSPEAPAPGESIVPVHAMTVDSKAHAGRANWSGDVRARFETPMAFRVGGKIIERPAQVGQLVKRGQMLARLDPEDLNLQKQAISAQIAAAETDLAQQTDDLARYRSLLDRGFISQAEYDRRQNATRIAKARVNELRSHFDTSRNQSAYAVLSADEDGVVTAVDAERGQVVAAGQPVVRVAQLRDKDVVITVPENKVTELRQAQGGLRVVLWSRPNRLFRGELRELSPVADPGTRTYTAKIAILDGDDDVRLGMTARVEADTAAAEGIMLPLAALYRKERQTAVWIIDPATQSVRLAAIKTGALQGDQITVAEGLKDGDRVVTAGVHKLHDGQKVRVVEAGS